MHEERRSLRISDRASVRVGRGHPWVFSNEVIDPVKDHHPGEVVDVADDRGRPIGVGYVNPRTLIAVRMLGGPGESIDREFLVTRLRDAIAYRERVLVDPRFGRLVFAESDRLPGVIVDRYGEVLVVQTLTAGAAALEPILIEALTETTGIRAVVLANDSPFREMEGLPLERRIATGPLPPVIMIEEYELRFEADVLEGQKTGYYLDQRDNRWVFASLVQGGEVLDLFCYTGSWSIVAARRGARVIGHDSSARALTVARRNAERNGVASRCTFELRDLMRADPPPAENNGRFDAVVVDPPPLARNRKARASAMRAMTRLIRDAAVQVRAGGLLVVCSCSYHLDASDLTEVAAVGAAKAGRRLRVITRGGQAADHPVLPAAPETEYLHALFLEVR